MDYNIQTLINSAAYVGSGIAMGLGAIGAGIGEGHTAAQADIAISRNPELSGGILKNMLVGQAIAESASIFSLVIAILLIFLDTSVGGALKPAALLGAGIALTSMVLI